MTNTLAYTTSAIKNFKEKDFVFTTLLTLILQSFL